VSAIVAGSSSIKRFLLADVEKRSGTEKAAEARWKNERREGESG
jgi:hypothetical protein